MQYQRPPTSSQFSQFRGIRNGFLAGLVVGMLIGWFFHGFIGLMVRFGFLLLFLVPLAVVVWFFFLRRGVRTGTPHEETEGRGMQVFTWNSREGSRRYAADPRRTPREAERDSSSRRDRDDEAIIDLEFRELRREVNRDE
jgi:predicted lipid-binding transport protein (Tim44 family)